MRDPSTQQVKAYNRAVECANTSLALPRRDPLTLRPPSNWMEAGGGFELFKEAFNGPLLPMNLAFSNSSSYYSLPLTFYLAETTGDQLLTHEGSGYTTYDETLFYEAALPLGQANETQSSWTVATLYSPEAQLPFTSFTCSSVAVTEPCSAIPPPPPPRAPLAPKARSAGAYVYAGAAAGATARRLLAASSDASSDAGGLCTVYYRKMSFLTSLSVVASPPETCGGGYCDNSTWIYALAPSCATSFTPQLLAVSQATYEADVASGFAWCTAWPDFFTPPHAEVTLRSIDDPVIAGGELTNCTFTLKPASAAFANAGFFLLMPGMTIALCAFFCLEGMCTPRSLSGLLGAPSAIDEAEAAGLVAPAPGYGATSGGEGGKGAELPDAEMKQRPGGKWT